MFNWLGLSALNTGLLWGTLLVASPIIIHLLNKRKYRIVDWAAMDFLLEADRRNRRRVRLEHLLLLLLRCLAVILLALLVSRIFVAPAGLAAKAVQSSRFERVFVLDDSPSMGARGIKKTAFEEAKESLAGFLRRAAEEHPGDTFTLLTTSRPNRPHLSGQFLSGERSEQLVRAVESLELTDRTARLEETILALEEQLQSRSGNLNRIVYLVSDLRRREWMPQGKERAAGERGVPALLKRLRDKVDGLYVVDVGGERQENLAITEIATLSKTPVAGVPTRFEVQVHNFGQEDATDVEVAFTAGQAVPLQGHIGQIKAGAAASVPFTFTFPESGPVPVQAEIGADDLAADNLRQYAARVHDGIRMLLVDGEPSSTYHETETFFLERALAPPGEVASGNSLQVITESQFEGLSLEPFQVLFLCNLYRIGEERRAALEAWVKAGGGLVFFLGDQVDRDSYNEQLFREGQGLLPVRVGEVRGDERERSWVNLSIEAANHPVLKIFQGAQNPFLERVKLFRWWTTALPSEELSRDRTQILATLSDPEASPALVEKPFEKGRVLVATVPADIEWSSWPADPSYVVSILELAHYMARSTAGEGGLAVGVPIRQLLDPVTYSAEVRVRRPKEDEALVVQGVPTEDGKGLQVEFEETGNRGFYQLALNRRDGQSEELLFSVNPDPLEGDLRRISREELGEALADPRIAIVDGQGYLSQGEAGGKTELWRQILVALIVVLCAEQFLGWWFGRKL